MFNVALGKRAPRFRKQGAKTQAPRCRCDRGRDLRRYIWEARGWGLMAGWFTGKDTCRNVYVCQSCSQKLPDFSLNCSRISTYVMKTDVCCSHVTAAEAGKLKTGNSARTPAPGEMRGPFSQGFRV